MIKIEKRIVASNVVVKEATQVQELLNTEVSMNKQEVNNTIDYTSKSTERPEALTGETYRIKVGDMQNALYVTINDIILNKGTIQEEIRPFEIFLNSKEMAHYQWIVALTRVISAVFRITKNNKDVLSIVEELKSVFDPKGGHFSKRQFVPSVVAEIGMVIEEHLTKIGMIKPDELDEHTKKFIEEKQSKLVRTNKASGLNRDTCKTEESIVFSDIYSTSTTEEQCYETDNSNDDLGKEELDNFAFPESALVCVKCNVKAAVISDGCITCLNCAYSKCG